MEPFISIRLHPRYHENQELTDKLISMLDKYRGCADDVWLTSLLGFPNIEEHKKSAEMMRLSAEKLRAHGYKITLQLANTVGHGTLGREDSYEMFSEHMVDINGNLLMYHNCPNNEQFLKYVYDYSKIYSEALNPDYIFIDDDLRLIASKPGCYCDDCIKRFNELNNYKYSRESLKSDMFEKENVELTVKWREFCDLSLSGVVKAVISGAKNSVNEVKIGLQLGNHVNYELYQRVCQTIIDMTGNKPLLRAGGGAYGDTTPFDLVRKAYCIQYQCEFLSDYIDNFRPELESFPHIPYKKSPRGFNAEAAINLAAGCNSLSYASIVFDNEPLEHFEPLFKAISEYRGYFEKIAELSENSFEGGLKNPVCLQKLEEDIGYNDISAEMEMFLRCGIPFSYSKECDSDTVYIDKRVAQIIQPTELKKLLKKNVIVEALAFEEFRHRGMLELFGIEYRVLTAEDILPENEIFTDDVINEGISDNNWFCPFWLCNESKLEFAEEKNMRVLTRYAETGKPASFIAESKFGGKFVCFGCTGSEGAPLNSSKALMIKRVLSELSGEGLAYFEAPVQLISILRLTNDKKLKAVTLFNYGMDYIENTKLIVKNTNAERAILLQPKKEQTELDSLLIPQIEPGGIVTVEFVERELQI